MPVFLTIVLDGVGIGSQPDAAAYGDEGSNTLAHVCAAVHPLLPALTRLGLGCIGEFEGVPPVDNPGAAFGRMKERSAGKDSTTGHWELAGILLDRPFPTYPKGFPADVVAAFADRANIAGVLANHPASGTEVIERYGREHIASGKPIVYTSADSVFQVAAHVDVVPLHDLYAMCEVARNEVCVGEHAAGRVIARPFTGEPGGFTRLSDKRKDFAVRPPSPPVQELLRRAGIRTTSIGKVADLFDGVGFDDAIKTSSNEDGIKEVVGYLRGCPDRSSAFVWVNLVDFDQEYGHRNDAAGFGRALERFDRALDQILESLPSDSVLCLTADHGNDPTFPGTDHTREYVPLLVSGLPPKPLGTRETFADHAATVATFFGVRYDGPGIPFGATPT